MESKANLLTRDETFFGVCQGLGEDSGVPPNLLRLGIAFMLFWNPLAAAGAYATLGLVVALARFLFPVPATAAAAASAPASPEADLACVMSAFAADLQPVEAQEAAQVQAEPAKLAA